MGNNSNRWAWFGIIPSTAQVVCAVPDIDSLFYFGVGINRSMGWILTEREGVKMGMKTLKQPRLRGEHLTINKGEKR
jgi:hypothetical protein